MIAHGPLAGTRVVDFSLYLPGPYATRLLADLGAEVIRVEPPAGDPVLHFMPGAYEWLNRGKRAIRVDLKSSAGSELVDRLLRTADVVVEAFRPGVADKLGIGPDRATALRPGVIFCSLSGYGQTGPNRDRPGHDIGYEASGGGYAAVLAAGERPTVPHLPAGDLGGGLFAAMSICAALARPADDDCPVHIDVSLQEAIVHLSTPRVAEFLQQGREPDAASLAAFAPGTGLFETADGMWVALAAVENHFWSRMCVALDRPDLAEPPYETHAGRMAHRPHLRAAVAERVAELTLEDLARRLEESDTPMDVVRGIADVCRDPHLRARGMVHTGADGVPVVDFPVLLAGRRSAASDRLPDPIADEQELVADLEVR
jgi:crotonobetainyl-CoA:carnitine CoA-transferase CaiB-like acyl-CoA transferase